MFKLFFSLSMLMILYSCWPGPSYKGLDPRCREWDHVIFRGSLNAVQEEEYLKRMSTIDRYMFYVCVNTMNSWGFKRPNLFNDDSEQMLALAESLLQERIDMTHLYLLSRICLDIARVKPGLVRENKSLIDAIEAAANKVKSDFWRNWSLKNVQGIRKVIGQ